MHNDFWPFSIWVLPVNHSIMYHVFPSELEQSLGLWKMILHVTSLIQTWSKLKRFLLVCCVVCSDGFPVSSAEADLLCINALYAPKHIQERDVLSTVPNTTAVGSGGRQRKWIAGSCSASSAFPKQCPPLPFSEIQWGPRGTPWD